MFDTYICPNCDAPWGLDELDGITPPFSCPACGADIEEDDKYKPEDEDGE
jgi:transcription initiation factor IIE alpha subunit